MATESFREAYGVLQRHAQTLREQREPNIDDLLTIVTESVQAYKVCQQRIEAVKKSLEKAPIDTGVPSSNPPGLRVVASVARADDSDDIPF